MEFLPSPILRPYIQKYIVLDIGENIENEIFYPSGFIDLVIKFPGGNAATAIGSRHSDTPSMELLGHILLPARVSAQKGTSILIARLHPYSCSLFFENPVTDFTNLATDYFLINAKNSRSIYQQIID